MKKGHKSYSYSGTYYNIQSVIDPLKLLTYRYLGATHISLQGLQIRQYSRLFSLSDDFLVKGPSPAHFLNVIHRVSYLQLGATHPSTLKRVGS